MAKKKHVEAAVIQESRPYVLWRRVSTQEQGASGLGLEAQTTIAKTFMGKDPVEVFTDVYSGTKLRQCKGLWEAIDYCKKNETVLVIAKSDRCRNVSEALDILDAVGQNRLIFCDLPSSDRFILTVMWAMWERHAIMGRINTKIALAERKRQIKEDGGFISKAGNFCDHLGNKKGCDMSAAQMASAKKSSSEADKWRSKSPLYIWTANQILKGRPRKEILAEAAELYADEPDKFGTREGKVLTKGTLSRWAAEVIRRS